MNRNKILDFALIICIFIITMFVVPSNWIESNIVRFSIEVFLKIIGIILIYFYSRKNGLLDIKNENIFQTKNLFLIPYFLICFSNFFTLKTLEMSAINAVNLVLDIIRNIFVVLIEELVFRIILFGNLIKENRNKLITILICSVIFGAMHLLGISSLGTIIPCLIQTLYTSLIGIVLCIMYLISNSWIFNFSFHLLFNLFNNLLITYFVSFNSNNLNFYLINIIIGICFGIYTLFIYFRFIYKKSFLERADK